MHSKPVVIGLKAQDSSNLNNRDKQISMTEDPRAFLDLVTSLEAAVGTLGITQSWSLLLVTHS
jgi:hypothetical protein